MRILIVTQYFYPENFRINELAFELAKKGNTVDALVGIPNYPVGTYYKGYGLFRKRHEVVHDVNIYRCFQFQRGEKARLWRIIMNYISFVISASIWVVFRFIWRKKYDAIIAFEPSPITQILPAILLGSIRKTKVLSWIQDIWPDSITGRKPSPLFKRVILPPLNRITELIYKKSSKILVSSKGMSELVCRNANYSDKIEYVPNWCDDFKVCKKQIELDFPKGFNLMMAGNISGSIGLDDVLKLCSELSELRDLNIVFVGKGAKLDYFQEKITELGLLNVHFMGAFPYEFMGDVYSKSDALLLTLRKSEFKYLDVTVPSRLQAYLSSGKPIFAMVGTGAAEILEENDCGFVVPSGDYKKLAAIIKEKYTDEAALKEKGINARKTYEKYFTLEQGIEHFESIIKNS